MSSSTSSSLCSPIFALVFIVLSSVFYLSSSVSLSTTQKSALLRLPRLLGNPTSVLSWSTETDFCNLPPSPSLSLLCDDRGSLITLEVIGGGPKNGTIPGGTDSLFALLSLFPRLKTLTLSSLGLSGAFSGKCNRLRSIQNLNLSNNLFSGTIPYQIGSIKTLETLDLSDNRLSGQLPADIFFPPSLKILSLDRNRLSGLFPSSLSSALSLQILSLESNSFNGTLPNLNKLSLLEKLNVRRNKFGPGIPSFGPRLVYVLMAENQFRGVIPSSFAAGNNLAFLEELDLSLNLLIGFIPLPLFTLPELQILNLAGNRLSGNLPYNLSLSPTLKFIDLSLNLLTGGVPKKMLSAAVRNRTRSSNGGLLIRIQKNCFSTDLQPQNRINYCEAAAIALVGIPPARLPAAASGRHYRRNVTFLIGIATSAAVAILIAAVLVGVLVRKRKRQNGGGVGSGSHADVSNTTALSAEVLATARYISQTMKLGALGSTQQRIFTMRELNKATNFFAPSMLLGENENKNRKVYRGCLGDGSMVAIKCLIISPERSSDNSFNLSLRLNTLSKICHHHLINLLGYCLQTKDSTGNLDGIRLFLIFEFMPGGSLRAKISGVKEEGEEEEGLSWSKRLEAVIGAAKGVCFLHTGVVPGIFNTEISIKNILFDQSSVAKLSGYETALLTTEEDRSKHMRLMQHLDAPSESDRNNKLRKNLADKNDIFKFGLILLEIVLGRPAIVESHAGGLHVKDLDLLVTDEGTRKEVVDARIVGCSTTDSLNTVIEIAAKCLSDNIASRPSMEDVLWNLQYALQIQDTSNADSMLDETCTADLSITTSSSQRRIQR